MSVKDFLAHHWSLIKDGGGPRYTDLSVQMNTLVVLSSMLYWLVAWSYWMIGDSAGLVLFSIVGTFSALADGNLVYYAGGSDRLDDNTHVLDRIFATAGGIYYVIPRFILPPSFFQTIGVAILTPFALYFLHTARQQTESNNWAICQILWHIFSVAPMVWLTLQSEDPASAGLWPLCVHLFA